MATVTFAGSTLWNDATTGFASAAVADTVQGPFYEFERIARGNGLVAKEASSDPGNLQLTLNYTLTESEYTALRTIIVQRRNSIGSLSIPGIPTLNFCVLTSVTIQRSDPVSVAGVVKRFYNAVYTFQRTRS
jgi:hypothetical protein